jgi:aryl-alcohol dehydrogenase-like predicted oxidoreductase
MARRILGRTGLAVTPLGYGAMEIRGPRIWGGRPVTDAQAERILNAVLDAGINFIDTAYDYGLSEEHIGRCISHRRKEYYLATKCGCTVVPAGDHDETPHVWTRENLLHNIENSLRRMKTDYVDVWHLHNPSVEQVQAGDLVKVLDEVRATGKVRWIGISSTLPHITTFIEWGVFDTFQTPYSALERAHEQVITAASRAGAGTIIRGGVARGAPSLQRWVRVRLGLRRGDPWAAWTKARLDELRAPGESPTAFALRFTLSHPNMHTTIVGTMNPTHLSENVRAAEAGPLRPDVYAEAKRRLEAVGEKRTDD